MPTDPTSPAYRVASERLEELLAPRVASRTLQLGLKQVGLSPADADADDLDPVLKGPVFRQLQVTMPPDRARAAVRDVLRAMRDAEAHRVVDPAPADPASPPPSDLEDVDAPPHGPSATESTPSRETAPERAPGAAAGVEPDPTEPEPAEGAERAADALERLRKAMQPFNLYFEWPEVRALRSQLQRLQQAASAGEDPDGLVDEAYAQLEAVEAKHEAMLERQARDLDDLEGMLDALDHVDDLRVRRLDAHVKRLREAQASRQIVEAEIDRARGLAEGLRARAERETAAPGAAVSGADAASGAEDPGAASPPRDPDAAIAGPDSIDAADLAAAREVVPSAGTRLATATATLRSVERIHTAGVAEVRRRLERLTGPDLLDPAEAERDLVEIEARLEPLREEARLAARVAARLLDEDRLARILPSPDLQGSDRGRTSPPPDDGDGVRLVGVDATRDYARRLARLLPPRALLLLEGPLGAGKTTFVAALAEALGSDARVSSPTYTLVQEYPTPEGTLVHVDAYRLDDVAELEAMGLDDYLERARLVAVEWGGPLAATRPEAWRLRLDRPGADADVEERIARLSPGRA